MNKRIETKPLPPEFDALFKSMMEELARLRKIEAAAREFVLSIECYSGEPGKRALPLLIQALEGK